MHHACCNIIVNIILMHNIFHITLYQVVTRVNCDHSHSNNHRCYTSLILQWCIFSNGQKHTFEYCSKVGHCCFFFHYVLQNCNRCHQKVQRWGFAISFSANSDALPFSRLLACLLQSLLKIPTVSWLWSQTVFCKDRWEQKPTESTGGLGKSPSHGSEVKVKPCIFL